MKQYSKILVVLLITAFAVSVGYAQPSTIKKDVTVSNVLKVQLKGSVQETTFYELACINEGFLIEPSLATAKLNERSFAEVPLTTEMLRMRQRYYEKPPLLKSTRQFANFNKAIPMARNSKNYLIRQNDIS